MKLGHIEERRDLNPRGHIRQDKVQEYVRRLMNGETPPPIKVCSRTNVIVDGAQTFHAWREYIGEKWADREVDVLLIDDMPDPSTEPEKWRDRAADFNRDHGVPLYRIDRRRILADIMAKYGTDAALERARSHNETRESASELLGLLGGHITVMREAMEEAAESPASGPEAESSAPLPPPRVSNQRPEACTPGHLRSVTPPVRYHCRALRDALVAARGRLGERDREELGLTLDAIRAALGGMAEAV